MRRRWLPSRLLYRRHQVVPDEDRDAVYTLVLRHRRRSTSRVFVYAPDGHPGWVELAVADYRDHGWRAALPTADVTDIDTEEA